MDSQTRPADLKADLRRRLLESRASLDADRRNRLDHQICAHLLRFAVDSEAQSVAAFRAFRGEPELKPALTALDQAGRQLYLPVVEDEQMRFRRWTPNAPMVPNRYGIEEPAAGDWLDPEQLDLVLMPLVAYSSAGVRLGMGAGYYDRALSFCLARPEPRPTLIGIAFSLQQVDTLPSQPWDVPLDAVITERGLQRF